MKNCKQLKQISIENESNLQTIEKSAFDNSSIESFTIPSQVTVIQENAFCYCFNLQKVEIGNDSKLQIIEEKAFYRTSIGSITIPPHDTQIERDAFEWCTIIEFIVNSETEDHNLLVFKVHENTILMFPAKTTNRFKPNYYRFYYY